MDVIYYTYVCGLVCVTQRRRRFMNVFLIFEVRSSPIIKLSYFTGYVKQDKDVYFVRVWCSSTYQEQVIFRPCTFYQLVLASFPRGSASYIVLLNEKKRCVLNLTKRDKQGDFLHNGICRRRKIDFDKVRCQFSSRQSTFLIHSSWCFRTQWTCLGICVVMK